MERAAGKRSWTDVSRASTEWGDMGGLMDFALRMYQLGPRTIFALDMEMRRATQGERGGARLLRYLMQHYAAEDRGFGEDELDGCSRPWPGRARRSLTGATSTAPSCPTPARFLDVIGYRFEQGELASVAQPSAAQLAARRDYFSPRASSPDPALRSAARDSFHRSQSPSALSWQAAPRRRRGLRRRCPRPSPGDPRTKYVCAPLTTEVSTLPEPSKPSTGTGLQCGGEHPARTVPARRAAAATGRRSRSWPRRRRRRRCRRA
jgi:hypothetical protein